MRAGKVLLLMAVVALGAGLQTAVAVRDNISLGPLGCRILRGRFEGPSYSFESSVSPALPAGARLHLRNAFGSVRVRAGQPGQAKVHLRKVVFLADERRARDFAEQVRLSAEVDGGELRVHTNRDERADGRDQDVGFETHFEIELPPGTPVVVDNEHGAVDVSDVASAQVDASFDGVRLERVAGDARVKAHHADVLAAGVGGTLSVESRHGQVELRDVTGRVALDVEHGDVAVLGAGATEVQLRFGDLKAERLSGGLRLRGEHVGVQVNDVGGATDIETGFRDVKVRAVRGDVRVAAQHSVVDVADVGGALYVKTTFDDVSASRIHGPVEIEVEHGAVHAQAIESGAQIRSSGDNVSVDQFRGPLQIDVERGDVALTPAGPLAEDVTATVVSGSLTLVVPADSRGRFDAQAERGEITLADVPGLSVVAGEEHATGVLGGGGGAITLRTRHGDLRLEGRAK